MATPPPAGALLLRTRCLAPPGSAPPEPPSHGVTAGPYVTAALALALAAVALAFGLAANITMASDREKERERERERDVTCDST